MRALFLDIDGVLHPLPAELQPGRTIRGKPVARAMSRPPLFCWLPILVQLLDGHDDVKVVVHSTWRENRTVAEIADLLSLGNRHVECTCGGDKLASIQHWLREHSDVTDFRILDDMPLSDQPPTQLIQCEWRQGLSEPRVQRELAAWLGSDTES